MQNLTDEQVKLWLSILDGIKSEFSDDELTIFLEKAHRRGKNLIK